MEFHLPEVSSETMATFVTEFTDCVSEIQYFSTIQQIINAQFSTYSASYRVHKLNSPLATSIDVFLDKFLTLQNKNYRHLTFSCHTEHMILLFDFPNRLFNMCNALCEYIF